MQSEDSEDAKKKRKRRRDQLAQTSSTTHGTARSHGHTWQHPSSNVNEQQAYALSICEQAYKRYLRQLAGGSDSMDTVADHGETDPNVLDRKPAARSLRPASADDGKTNYTSVTSQTAFETSSDTDNGFMVNQLSERRASLAPISGKMAARESNRDLFPSEHDILFGRGKRDHPGNLFMRRMADEFRDSYNRADAVDKSTITGNMLKIIKATGRRFLKQVDGNWNEAVDEEARAKIGHVLRNGRNKPLKKIIEDIYKDDGPPFPDGRKL